jgi:hypothetical protein
VTLGRSADRDATRHIPDLAGYLTGRNASGSSEATAGPSGLLTFPGNLDEDISASATPESIQKVHDRCWADWTGRPRTKDSADSGLSTRATPASLNASNAKFWAKQPTFRFGREFGKG